MVPGFVAGADFAIDKPAGTPCPNLLADHRCGIHDRLRPSGFRGCVVFDCFGAGQRLVAEVPGAARWRSDPGVLTALRDLLPRVRRVHELLWHLDEVRLLCASLPETAGFALPAADLHAKATALPADADAEQVGAVMRRGGDLLDQVSRAVRAAPSGPSGSSAPSEPAAPPAPGAPGAPEGRQLRGADLVGRDLRDAALARADLRNALLIAADLRGVELERADLLGADLRDADMRGADLSGSLFLTQPQLDAARGDTSTSLPVRLHRPDLWT